jgi:hypothetical protein
MVMVEVDEGDWLLAEEDLAQRIASVRRARATGNPRKALLTRKSRPR